MQHPPTRTHVRIVPPPTDSSALLAGAGAHTIAHDHGAMAEVGIRSGARRRRRPPRSRGLLARACDRGGVVGCGDEVVQPHRSGRRARARPPLDGRPVRGEGDRGHRARQPVAGGLDEGLLARPGAEEPGGVRGRGGSVRRGTDVPRERVQVGDVAQLLDVQPDRTVRPDRHSDEVTGVAEGEPGAAREDRLAVRRAAAAGAVEGEGVGRRSRRAGRGRAGRARAPRGSAPGRPGGGSGRAGRARARRAGPPARARTRDRPGRPTRPCIATSGWPRSCTLRGVAGRPTGVRGARPAAQASTRRGAAGAGGASPATRPGGADPDQPVRRTGLIRRPCAPLAWGAAPRPWDPGTVPPRRPRRAARLGRSSVGSASGSGTAGADGVGSDGCARMRTSCGERGRRSGAGAAEAGRVAGTGARPSGRGGVLTCACGEARRVPGLAATDLR